MVTRTEIAYTQFIALVRLGKYHTVKESTQSKTVYEVAKKKSFIELIAMPSELVQSMIDEPEEWKEEYPDALSNVLIMELGYDPFG